MSITPIPTTPTGITKRMIHQPIVSRKERIDLKSFIENYSKLLRSIEKSEGAYVGMYKSFIDEFRDAYNGRVPRLILTSSCGELTETLMNKRVTELAIESNCFSF